MKTSLCVLFAMLLASLSSHYSLKFEYTTVSKTENSQSTKLEQVIKSHKTHVSLIPVKDFNKVDQYNYKSVSNSNMSNQDLSKAERFKSLEKEKENELNMTKFEVPVIIPSLQRLDDSNKSNINKALNLNRKYIKGKKGNDFGMDVDFQHRLNDASIQSVSNKQAFNAIYPNPGDYTSKVAVNVFDINYDKVKADFSAKLTSILDENLIGMPVQHASELKNPNLKLSITNQDFKDLDPEELNEIKGYLNEDNSKQLSYRKK